MNTFYANDRIVWRKWLSEHFETEQEIWLVFPTKASGEKSVSYNDAVEEALCFGWIDGRAGTLDETHHIRRFTPRRKGSSYSQPNIERLIRLYENNMLHPKIKVSVKELIEKPFVFPKDILAAIKKDETAWNNYCRFSESYKRIRIAYIEAARKRPEEFSKRLDHFISKTRENKLIVGYGGIEKYYKTAPASQKRNGKMNYRIIDKSTYYRKDTYRRFTEDCKCSTSITARLDVTEFAAYSKLTNTKFYINFLYILTKVLNSRDDYKMDYWYKTDELVCYDVINPTHYVFREETETCTPVYSEYNEDYQTFYQNILADIDKAKISSEPAVYDESHPNWFDASYLPWVSYDSLHMELPDGYLYFPPVVHWGKYREENGRLMMPVTVRMNHAIADGYLIAKVFDLLEKEIKRFINK